MNQKKIRVGIIGCGTAGPALALFLARAGHEVEIFERAPELLPVGTGFLLQPTGQFVLERLGLRESAAAYASQIGRLYSNTVEGRTILDLAYSTLGEDVEGFGMHRATLLGILVEAAEEAGVVIHCGTEIDRRESRGVRQTLFCSSRGQRYGPYDLVVVANGAQSQERNWVSPPTRARQYPWGALWAITPDSDQRFTGELQQVVDGTTTMAGFLDTGVRSVDPDRTPLVSFFWSLRVQDVGATLQQGHQALADRIIALRPNAASALETIQSIEEWNFAGYMDVVLPRWHNDGCVVLGDAAHAMSPQLGQGVNLALWDAWVLSECISSCSGIDEALARYDTSRRSHIQFYQFATRWLTPFFQSSIPLAGWTRDRVFPLAAAVPSIERQMLRAMAGLKCGIFRRSLDLPHLRIEE